MADSIQSANNYWVKVRLIPTEDGSPGDGADPNGSGPGGIDLDPGKGFNLKIKNINESVFEWTKDAKEKLRKTKKAGLRPIIVEIVPVS